MASLGYCQLLFTFFLTTSLFFSPSSSFSSSSSAAAAAPNTAIVGRPTKLVNSICNQTTNYKFCVDALYTDPRAPNADQIVLAYISFGLAYTNATNTQAYIKDLVVSALEEAYNNLNSETYFDLGKLAGDAAHAAVDCQHTFKPRHSPLTRRNKDVRQLCAISAVISTFFTS
ncbi:Pectinesterase inhibitor domain [Macleaya cordata]|uniref:Pectinesterase inhibitor domain n=1 Tax=Macleaya cordata TaxID=56857 RepID=A0A200RAG7_MACCD|nr:Pectinesterase inhibitor domain [Macleaya cordata]